MKLSRMKIENFRKLSDIEFEFGKKITVISGINGIGKSSLLALIASASGTNDKRLNGLQFHPEFSDLFKINPNEDYEKYRLFVEYDKKVGKDSEPYNLTKRISFKNDNDSGRGIRVIPRSYSPLNNDTRKNKITVEQAASDAGTTSKRVKIPTEYVSLSRLIPLGESGSKTKEVYKTNRIIQKGYTDFFTKCYNSVLSGSIETTKKPIFITKKAGVGVRKYLALNVKNTTDNTLSVGQDNLESLVASFTDFYALKQEAGDSYKGGILCIDEIDASLHPSAVRNLWVLLKNLVDDLNLQIIVTTHSLTVLKEICRLQSEDPEDYKLVYFKDEENPRLSHVNDYHTLKADMFDMVFGSRPEIKVYCEDEHTKRIFELLYSCIKNNLLKDNTDLDNLERLYGRPNVIDVSLGKEHLKGLPKKDDYFKTVLIVLDGDSKLKQDIDPDKALKINKKEFERKLTPQKKPFGNVLRLPSFYSPEVYLYKIMEDVSINHEEYMKFWNHVDTVPEITNITAKRMRNLFKINSPELNYHLIHNTNWMERAEKFAEQSDLIEFYYMNEKNRGELQNFAADLVKCFEAVRKTRTRNVFE